MVVSELHCCVLVVKNKDALTLSLSYMKPDAINAAELGQRSCLHMPSGVNFQQHITCLRTAVGQLKNRNAVVA